MYVVCGSIIAFILFSLIVCYCCPKKKEVNDVNGEYEPVDVESLEN